MTRLMYPLALLGLSLLAACQSAPTPKTTQSGIPGLRQVNQDSGNSVQGFRPAGLGDFKVSGNSANSN